MKGKSLVFDDVIFPKEFDTPACREAIREWLAYKKDRGQTYKGHRGLSAIFNSFKGHPPEALCEQINYSMTSGWAGVFPPKLKKPIEKPRPKVPLVATVLPQEPMLSPEKIREQIAKIRVPNKGFPEKRDLKERREELRRQIESIKNAAKEN